ncbi:hypothetical protein Golob_016046 [Gossypium lobatum]|uniref:Uncharacterized protein n=1 Tax=Gossypium lobatum TaxID=34289 RepID=A0A7J8M2Z0_9ROSI|nr:hypothetical protein [Gossypium lobatum]
MEKSVPLHVYHVNKTSIIISRAHAFLHSIALLFLIHYRLSFFFQHPKNTTIPTLPWLLIFVSELLLSLAWLFTQSYCWRPVTRTVFPERLPADDKLPAIDVFICTADPNKEPSVEVMNTVISAMALDYPPEKLHVYVSDDAGSDATLRCTKEAWNFARYWVPFCRKYDLVTACPDVYFSSSEVDSGNFEGSEFKAARTKMEGGFGWAIGCGAVRLAYFLSHATASNLTTTAIFTLTAVKLTAHPNSPLLGLEN